MSTKTWMDEIKGTADEIRTQLEDLIKKGKVRRLILKNKQGKVLFETQLNFGIAGSAILVVMAPILTSVGVILLYVNGVRVFIEREDEVKGTAKGRTTQSSSEVHVVEIIEEKPSNGAKGAGAASKGAAKSATRATSSAATAKKTTTHKASSVKTNVKSSASKKSSSAKNKGTTKG